MKTDQYLDVNQKAWNNKVDAHVASDFYDMKGFLAGQTSLNSIELKLLGNLKGKSVLHLQCHFGQCRHHSDCLFFADIFAQNFRKAADPLWWDFFVR